MKKNKFGIIWLIIIFGSFIISASMSQTNYFTYTFQYYFVSPLPYINFCSYVSMFLAFACGFFEIYNVKKLLRVFLLIQPIKLVYDFAFQAVESSFEQVDVPPMIEVLLLVISVYFAALYVKDKDNFKSNVKNNSKVILKTVLFGLLGLLVSILINAAAIVILLMISMTYDGYVSDYIILAATIGGSCIIVGFIAFVAARMLMKLKSTSDLFEFDGTKTERYVLPILSIALTTVYHIYLFSIGGNIYQFIFMG
ncbi:MAG: hypothetical protein IKU89_05115 [Oscillospiraceae bacterium]|nr:hypothetical protein [Oscillospiraceae bacterium]